MSSNKYNPPYTVSESEEQITAVLEGKRVVASKKEIDEVLGAAAAYEQIEYIDRRGQCIG